YLYSAGVPGFIRRPWRTPLGSGHLRSITFVQGVTFCADLPVPRSLLASPAHLLDFWGISLRHLCEEQDLVRDTITRKGQMDLV
ncbi:hypothetical protein TNCV_1592671, partial [Trichonephila clavipes]